MGMAGIVYGIITIYSSNRQTKIYYGIVALLGIYTMFLSGTRGAMAVPLGGLMLFGLISKKAHLVLSTFFRHPHIPVFCSHIYRSKQSYDTPYAYSFPSNGRCIFQCAGRE